MLINVLLTDMCCYNFDPSRGGDQEKNCGTYHQKICRASFGTHPQIFSKNANFSPIFFGPTPFFHKDANFFFNIFETHPFFSQNFTYFFLVAPPPSPPLLLNVVSSHLPGFHSGLHLLSTVYHRVPFQYSFWFNQKPLWYCNKFNYAITKRYLASVLASFSERTILAIIVTSGARNVQISKGSTTVKIQQPQTHL